MNAAFAADPLLVGEYQLRFDRMVDFVERRVSLSASGSRRAVTRLRGLGTRRSPSVPISRCRTDRICKMRTPDVSGWLNSKEFIDITVFRRGQRAQQIARSDRFRSQRSARWLTWRLSAPPSPLALRRSRPTWTFSRKSRSNFGPGRRRPGALTVVVSPKQQRILYSAVFLHLYNLVESTITGCFNAVTRVAMDDGWMAGDLTEPLRREWIKVAMKTHSDMQPESPTRRRSRLPAHRLLAAMPVPPFKFQKGMGTWDDQRIEEMGWTNWFAGSCQPPSATRSSNAHTRTIWDRSLSSWTSETVSLMGNISFRRMRGRSGRGRKLRELRDTTVTYMREVPRSLCCLCESPRITWWSKNGRREAQA